MTVTMRELTPDSKGLDPARYPTLPLIRGAFELRSNVTAYDATYVALAEQLQCVLLTAYGRLAVSPTVTCAVEVHRR